MIKVFISYSHNDETTKNELQKHLAVLERNGIIEPWYDRKILAGDNLKTEIDSKLLESNLILLLVSPNFLASEYCYSKEMKKALEMRNQGSAWVIPIILEYCDWINTPLKDLLACPQDGRPISQHSNRDKVFNEIAQEIRKVIDEIVVNKSHLSKSRDLTGGGGATETRATVIACPTFPDPLASSETPEYAGISYYIVRLDSSRFENWQADHQPTYQLNSQVIDPANNRVYTMNNSKGIENPALAPHENPTDWEISDEIKIEYAEGFDIEGREIPIKDFVPVFPIGASVRIANRTLKDGSTRYLMVGLLPVGGAEGRTLAMVNGKISAVFG